MFDAFAFNKGKKSGASCRALAVRASGFNKDPVRGAKEPKFNTKEIERGDEEGHGFGELYGDERAPLRLIIIGHNPSAEAWRQGHYYAHKSNRMWPILKQTGIAPPSVRGAEDDHLMPSEAGVGFTDVGTGNPGTDSRNFGDSAFRKWAPGFLERIKAHAARVSRAVGCPTGHCGAPAFVAFSGKKQFVDMCNALAPPKARKLQGSAVPVGAALPREILPPGWPLPETTEVWVMTSTSGAAALSAQDRIRPWQCLADRLTALPWPVQAQCQCHPQKQDGRQDSG